MLPRLLFAAFVGLAVTPVAFAAPSRKDPLLRFDPVPPGEPIPAVDFFRSPLWESARLNADGSRVAAIVPVKGDSTGLMFYDVASGKTQGVKGVGDRDIYKFSWLTNDRLLFNVSFDRIWAEGLYVVDVKRPDRLFPVENKSAVSLVGIPRSDPLRPLVWVMQNYYDKGADFGVIQVDATVDPTRYIDLKSGMRGTIGDYDPARHGVLAAVARTFPKPDATAFDYYADRDGNLAFVLTEDAAGKPSLLGLVDGRWKPCAVDLATIEVEEAGDAPGELLVLAPREPGRPRALRRMDAFTGELGEVLVQDDDYDCEVDQIHRDCDDGHVLGVSYHRAGLETVWLGQRRKEIQALVARSFPGQTVRVLESDKSGKRFLVATHSDRHPLSYQMLDMEKRSLSLLKRTRPWIDPERMRPTQTLHFVTRDAVTLEAFLTLPAGASRASPAPLVVLPHGGPWARDSWGWDGEVQFLASRGYAVFQPNYRGSLGYQWKAAGSTDDFRKMHNDVTDGVKEVIASGVVDPKRIAIMGTSFGGYLAVCGAVFEPDLYRCAVSMAGVFDWEQMLREARRGDRQAHYKFWSVRLGDPVKDAEKFLEISPLRHIGDARIPFFVWHGREDQTVSMEQSQRLVQALASHGIPCEASFARGEAHGAAFLQHRVELYTAVEAFLARNLGAGGS